MSHLSSTSSPRSRRTRRARAVIAAAVLTAALVPATAGASLTLLKPNPTDPATFVGTGGYSADGLGQFTVGGVVSAEVPAGSTVQQAYLYGTYFTFEPSAADKTIDLDGTLVVLTKISGVNVFLSTARADVTAQVAAKVGAGGGITDFAVNNDPSTLDGVGLVVIYSNPTLPTTTIAVLDGGASQTGDSASFNFAAPLDKTTPGFSAIMSLGSGFSFQGSPGHECGTGAPQASIVDVNAQRLTSCAGNYDDGDLFNGALITVGGVGDDILNPFNPFQAPADGGLPRVQDDELYDINPFLVQGDAGVTIATSNPSQDDNLFLSVIAITARATVSQENCTNGIDDDGDGLIDGADPDCAPPPTENCTNGIDDDGDGLVDNLDPDCPSDGVRRMGGGGSVKTTKVKDLSHGFMLHCDASAPGLINRLEVNWSKNKKFHLTELTSATCSDDPAISEGKPVVGIDTLRGRGTGRYNGVAGATAEWTFTDAGEPGRNDRVQILIRDVNGAIVLDATGTLASGNNQALPAG